MKGNHAARSTLRLTALAGLFMLGTGCALWEDLVDDDDEPAVVQEDVEPAEQERHEAYQQQVQQEREARIEKLADCVETAEENDDEAGVRDCYRRYGG